MAESNSNPPARQCAACGDPLARKPGETVGNWKKRKSCCDTCSNRLIARARTKIHQPHQCRICGNDVPRRQAEKAHAWKQRHVCEDPACVHKARSDAALLRHAPRRGDGWERTCSHCGNIFYPKPGVHIGQFNVRTVCDDCWWNVRLAAGRAANEVVKTCEICGQPYTRRYREGIQPFERRRACSRACTGALLRTITRTDPPAKACAACGVLFERRADERAKKFKARRTCGDPECRNRMIVMTRDGRYPRKDDDYPVEFLRKRDLIRERDGFRCRECGAEATSPLHVHHINYLKADFSDRNLITLCGSCHGKTNHHRDYWKRRFMTLMTETELAPAA